MSTTLTAETGDTRSAWGAVMSMALCVSALIASEFMPVSLLTPIAGELGVSEGQAGQMISISGLFAVITSLTIAGLTSGVDRKQVQSAFAILLIVSALIVASPYLRWQALPVFCFGIQPSSCWVTPPQLASPVILTQC